MVQLNVHYVRLRYSEIADFLLLHPRAEAVSWPYNNSDLTWVYRYTTE